MSAAVVEFLLRLGDDRLVLGHRLSEWCGHAPIVEEDIALANLALDCIGQACAWLELAGELEGRGRSADQLAFFRGPPEFRNCLLVEQPNGDFACTVVRQVLFDAVGANVLEQLSRSRDARIAAIAARALVEVRYHVRHGRDWWLRLGDGTEDSHLRMQHAVDELWPFGAELVASDEIDRSLAESAVGADLELARAASERELAGLFARTGLERPEPPPFPPSGGRQGKHGEQLDHLLSEMQSVARAHPGAQW
jgi:ring-1,2-phenylacetyl-CoA epoxidase subunit PaaC